MTSVLRKRKIIDTHHGAHPSQPSVASFGRVSKAGASHQAKKSLGLHKKPQASTARQSAEPSGKENKRRKLDQPAKATNEKTLGDHPLNIVPKVTKTTKPRPAHLGPSAPDTPVNERRIFPLKSKAKVTDSPTKGARAILEAFVIASPAPAFKGRGESKPISSSTLSQSQSTTNAPSTFPQEFQDLVDLHTAFLSALSLHYAHHGTSSPAILSELRPSIERTWGKRRVEAGDVQRLLGIQQFQSPQESKQPSLPALSIVDFGRTKLGIEFSSTQAIPKFGSPLPTTDLQDLFKANLQYLLSLSSSAAALPLAPIVPFATNQAPMIPSKGALRLFDLRATAVQAQAATAVSDGQAPPSQRQSTGTNANAASRSAGLLERIRNKETLAASQPSGPTKEQLDRRAALMRLEEVIPVIDSLAGRSSGGGVMGAAATSRGGQSRGMSSSALDLAAALGMGAGRSAAGTGLGMGMAGMAQKTVSFTMPALVQHLQMSLKHPISPEEAERCVALLAKEVLPSWCQMRELGKLKSVSVRGCVGRGEWTRKLMELLEE